MNRKSFTRIGPEIITAASDNDPTNVGTAAAVGAQTGYQLSWLTLLVAPLLAVVLSIAAQVGVVARADLQSLVLRRYGRVASGALLISVVAVNVVTVAADLQAGAAGIGLLTGVSSRLVVLPLGLALTALLLAGRYRLIVAMLRYALAGFLSFGIAALLARPNWHRLAEGSLIPTIPLNASGLAGALALLGTTLTGYVYMWETVVRGVEEPCDGPGVLRRARTGAVLGSIGTAVILWFMLVACAATLGRRHATVSTAQDAAAALRPLAGQFAAGLFAAGLLASALVSIPVLMAATAHVTAAQFGKRRGLSGDPRQAPFFTVILLGCVGLATGVDLAGVPLLGMLLAASVIGGFGTPLGLILMVRLARDPAVMGARTISRKLAAAGWAVALAVGGLGLLYLAGAAAGKFLAPRLPAIPCCAHRQAWFCAARARRG